MSLLLERLGAEVTGVSLSPAGNLNLYHLLSPWQGLKSAVCDIRDKDALKDIVQSARPEIVMHMAAQAIVKEGYADPLGTIATNVMGTVQLLEVLRSAHGLLTVLVITSDKVYENRETGIDFAEMSPLGGYDPYSASKAAAEILTSAYRRSFFSESGIPVVTARAGNVIGGGDWAADRLIPDLWRARESGRPVLLRNPDAVRPWQHVLDPLYGYLLYTQSCLAKPSESPPSLNFGPPREPIRTVLQVAQQFGNSLEAANLWTAGASTGGMHESRFLSIDSSLALSKLGWKTALSVDEAIRWTCDWYGAYQKAQDVRLLTGRQIDAYAERVQEPALGFGVAD